MLYLIKNTLICVVTFYIFSKFLNIRSNKKQFFVSCFLSFFLTTICGLSNKLIDGFDIYLLIFLLSFSLHTMHKKRYDITLFICIFSYSISLLLSLFSMTISAPIMYFLGQLLNYNYTFKIISCFFVGLLSLVGSSLLFKIKKLKRGLPFLEHNEFAEESFLICFLIIFIYTFFRFRHENATVYLLLILVFALLCIILIIRSGKQSNNLYKQKYYERYIEALDYELNSLTAENNDIKKHNTELGQLIHRDNKLIPAIESAVEELLKSYNKEVAKSLLLTIKTLSSERKGILNKNLNKTINLTSLNNIRANAIINYMNQKAYDFNIDFKISLEGEITKMIDQIVSEDHFCTIIADLIENAIIACKTSENKHILLKITALDNNYSISICDSAHYFSKAVIKRLGKTRYTTHKKDGGTGFGLMTVFEIANQYQASFSLDETLTDSVYTKSVSIHFNNESNHTYNNIPL